jgi:uncharacterized protein (TIRG00374 family)
MKRLLKVTISLILVGVILWKFIGVEELGDLITDVSPAYLILICMVTTLDRALMTLKWAWLLRSQGVYLPLLLGMKIYCASMLWGMLLPTTVGADAIRAFSICRKGLDASKIIASIIIERMVGFLSALVLGLLSLTFLTLLDVLDDRFVVLWWIIIAMMISGTVVLVVSFSQKIFDLLHGCFLNRFQHNRIIKQMRQFHLAYLCYRDNQGTLLVFFAVTFVEQFFPILFAWLIALSMHIDVSLLLIAGAIPLAMLISRIPIGVDGVGVSGGVFVLLIFLARVSPAEAFAISLVGRIIQVVSFLPWWLAHAIDSGSIRQPQLVVGGNQVST